MGVCPKKAVTLINAGRPETISVVPMGTTMAEVMELVVPAVK
jgi:hypothetical protein